MLLSDTLGNWKLTFCNIFGSGFTYMIVHGPSTKPGSNRLDRIGLQIGSYRIGLVFSLLVQNNYFEKSCACFYDTGGSDKKFEFP